MSPNHGKSNSSLGNAYTKRAYANPSVGRRLAAG